MQILCERHPEMSEAEVRSHLGSFGVGRLAVQLVGSLSGRHARKEDSQDRWISLRLCGKLAKLQTQNEKITNFKTFRKSYRAFPARPTPLDPTPSEPLLADLIRTRF